MKEKRIKYNRLHNETSIDETSPDGSETETSDILTALIPGNYALIPVQEKSSQRFYVPVCGLVFYVMALFGFFCVNCVRQSLSVAIVAMVNHTAAADMDVAMANASDQHECPRDPELEHLDGEFNWDRHQQAILLSARFYGQAVTLIPGGLAADRFGGKWLFGGCILLSSLVALLAPAAARLHIGVLITLQVLSGLGDGALQPGLQALVARWSSPHYRSLVMSVIFGGRDAGIVVGLVVTGVLCEHGFAGGWPSAFYVFGTIGCVWSLAWFFLCYNSPYTHPRISAAELIYWEREIGSEDLVSRPPTPWRKIFTSLAVWALAIARFAFLWGFYTIGICLPLYLHDILGFNMTKNGVFSAVPFMASFLMIPVCGTLVDWLRSPGRLSTTVVRKTFCVVGFTSTSFLLIATGYVGCNRALAMTTLIAIRVCLCMAVSSVGVNQQDLAPLHAGKIMGLVSSVGNLGIIGAPLAMGVLTYERSTRDEWRKVFFLAAVIYTACSIVFAVFGSGQRQSWANVSEADAEQEFGRNQASKLPNSGVASEKTTLCRASS